MTEEIQDRLKLRASDLKALRKRHVAAYERELQEAKEKRKPIVWAMALMPVEILRAMDLQPYYPELECGASNVRQQGGYFCEAAEQIGGYSRDLCSLLKGAIGMAYKDERSGAKFLPHPDLIVGEGSQCDAFAKGWEIVSKFYKVPLFRVDGPFCLNGGITEHELEWGVSEIKRLITFVEEYTNTKFDMDRLKEALTLSAKSYEIIERLMEHRKSIPEPIGVWDSMRHWSYLILYLGTAEALEYWSLVLEEVEDKVANHIGAVENEKFRLWYDQGALLHMGDWWDYLEQRGAVTCFERNWLGMGYLGMYLHGYRIDPEKPFESLALRHFYSYLNVGFKVLMDRAIWMASEYQLDGAILPANTTCKIYSQSVFEKARILREKCGIPSLVFDVDCFDERDTDREKIFRTTDQFLEILELSKAGKRGAG